MHSLKLKKRLLIFTLLCLWLSPALNLLAQTNDVCRDGDCDPALQSVQLADPLQSDITAGSNNQRTEQYKAAYLQVKQIKTNHAADSDWSQRYNDNELNGASCLRLNQLEGYFAHEYAQNPDFAAFIDQQETNVSTWKENGFQASRRAINMQKRIDNKCPEETKKMEKGPGPSLENLPPTYQKLGQVQGYFDEKGNLLKPLDNPTATNTEAREDKDLSKRDQIAQLKQMVGQLPVGPQMTDQINGIAGALGSAQPKVGGLLNGLLGPLNSQVGNVAAGPAGALSKIDAARGILGALKNFKPRFPGGGLLSKIGNLFNTGEDLVRKAKDLADKGKKLKDNFDQLRNKAENLKDELEKRKTAAEQLKQALDELAKKKADLTQQLEDRPRRILDELTDAVADAKKKADELTDKVKTEDQAKDGLLDDLKDLEKAKAEIEQQLENLKEEQQELTKAQEDLTQETKAVEEEVEKVKEQEKDIDELAQKLEDLKSERAKEEEIAACESVLKKLLARIAGADEVQEKIKKKAGGIFAWPGKLLGKLSDLKLFQNKLKIGENGVPLVGKALAKVDELMAKVTTVSNTVEGLTGKKTGLQQQIDRLDQQLDQAKALYDDREKMINGYKDDLVKLITEKSGLQDKLGQGQTQLAGLEGQVQDFIGRFNLFDEASNCLDREALQDKIEALQQEQSEIEPELDALENDLQAAEQQADDLEAQTQQLEELQQEADAIREEFGSEVQLEPVSVEEWSESFSVERPYWDAVFHPDDEVVEGYRGRYFEVRLKDAEKTVKLLFGAGQYNMTKTEFRKRYGTTIGTFATEALQAIRKADREQVKLFIQGSADLAGHTTFSGNLDESYPYAEIEVLPQTSNGENFSGSPVVRTVPERNFRNDHLPDLRARYLKEMISVYSKKFDPIILEGAVKQFQDEEERNAIIYLFIPEQLLEE